ncbi:DNA methyltransferase [Limnospira sp.]|uniref:DNA methyltransferase n=1 Tax=Limnospira sp. TaxID=3100384 RepID=UPI003F6F105A
MNAVEIEEAVSQLAEAPFDPEAFPYSFLEAFGNKATTIKRLKSDRHSTNQSDLPGGVLQRHNIHLKVCPEGEVTATLTALRESPATTRYKVKFILATDGKSFEAESLVDGETVACDYPDFSDHFGFFLPLAGITTVRQIRENAFDIKATGRLNRLYVELLKLNPDWDKAEGREKFNHFMARLIFCFFAEDTNIFHSEKLFTNAIAQMSAADAANTDEVLSELFRAMATPHNQREAAGIRNWANVFPYVNGGLFGPHPLTPSPKPGEGGQETLTPLSSSGRGAGGEGALNFSHPLTPSVQPGEGGQETLTPLSSSGRGAGGEGEMNFSHPLTPSPKPGEGGQETLTPLSSSGRGAGGEGKYWEVPPALKKKMTEVARQFRKEPTPSEHILWQGLRGRKLEGRKFRRQQPIGVFIVDFFCGAERLIVEVDGGIHKSQQEADQQRQELLESLGLRVIRLSSELVETNLDEALAVIRQAFGPHPLTPSPKPGEGGQETLTPLSSSGRGAGGEGVPRFNKIARSYLLHVGNLDWKKINPDIFGSMIQAVADEEERGALGMHYTSVPNILKVLNPLFLDDLRSQLDAAGENRRKLLNLRQRLAKIRVFDPACGSGNFLVIAYKEMRKIEAEINRRRGEPERPSQIPLTNFRGIEIRHFAAEIARLALIIAEYQCDVLHRGQMLALADFLPLKNDNWITCGNALRLDWLSLCPPTGTGVKVQRQDLDLWGETQDEAEIDFQNEGGETYICGNPPYKGSNWRTKEQTEDIGLLFASKIKIWKPLDYVCGWFIKASEYSKVTPTASAFVATNSICQGVQASILWPLIYESGQEISFAHTSFKWANLASHNAGVSVVIVGFCNPPIKNRKLYEIDKDSVVSLRTVENINAYLLNAQSVFVESTKVPVGLDSVITDGSGALDGGHLILNRNQRDEIIKANSGRFAKYILPYLGSGEFIKGNLRWCLWIEDENLSEALENAEIYKRVDQVRKYRENSGTRAQTAISRPHKFAWINKRNSHQIIVPTVFSERRDYITAGYLDESYVINNAASIIQEPSLYILAIISSTLHLSWVRAVSGKLEDRIRYTSSTCYNTFPVPTLTEQNKADLNRCAEDILLAREHYFPATIADMYDPKRMDIEFPLVREAHDRNDEIIERIYIGRRFKNDTERLEKLFDLYTKMTSQPTPAQKSAKRKTKS